MEADNHRARTPRTPAGTDETRCWVMVPIKALDQAKQRLRPRLGAEVEALSLAMAADVLAALAASRLAPRVVVVTADERVARLARDRGAQVVFETAAGGLNRATALGLEHIRSLGGRRALILPSDIPLLTGPEVDRLLDEAAARRGDCPEAVVSLCASADGAGTNWMDLGLDHVSHTRYGDNSFPAHRQAAERAGGRVLELRSRRVGLDIDRGRDLDAYIAFCHACPAHQDSETWRFLAGAGRADAPALPELARLAAGLRDQGHGQRVTYSPKVFIPLTRLCRDVCHYCTFATVPKRLPAPYMSADEAVEIARQGKEMGCREALFTLGEKPELRYAAAREALADMGFATTLEYVAHVAGRVMSETGLLPHINAGCMTPDEIAMLRPVSASMGIMLENVSPRLCARGQVHYGSPDKEPSVRLRTIADAGRAGVPFTTGILIGIGETREEILQSLAVIHELHERFGHIQEVIIQNFVPKAGTKMAAAPAPSEQDLLWTIAMARVMFGQDMSIQAPPNLNPGRLEALVGAGINDWGGVSPLTPDHVNPESPWPHIAQLAEASAKSGKLLLPRLTVYPAYIFEARRWLDANSLRYTLRLADGEGLAREDDWLTGHSVETPGALSLEAKAPGSSPAARREIRELLDIAVSGERDLDIAETARLFGARGAEFDAVCAAADTLRTRTRGDEVTYVINRNINYTNICTYRCAFCAFAKGRKRTPASDAPYLKPPEEVAQLALEARARGATEVCLQGGIHPSFTGQTYLDILDAVRDAAPDIHIHAFSPLEVTHGARSLGLPLGEFLGRLKQAGLKTLPGTAAEILDDEVRDIICPDKITSAQWIEVVETAHGLGLATTATIMFGHVDGYRHWATHLHRLLELQRRSAGITEFVPLPFVAEEAPIYRRGQARQGPSFRESVLMHAVARLVLGRDIPNIQTSWVKMGLPGAQVCLRAGANDIGGTLMNESITRAAGAQHGQEMTPPTLEAAVRACGRTPRQRNTLYQNVAA